MVHALNKVGDSDCCAAHTVIGCMHANVGAGKKEIV